MQNVKKLTRAVVRRHPKLSDKQMTDQSIKKLCCINNIVEKFSKTGLLPENTKIPQYLDMSHVPTLEESYDVTIRASNAFYALPAALRKLINNDPSELLNFIADGENKEICIKYGLIEKPAVIINGQKPANIIDNKEIIDEKISDGKNTTSDTTS